jgi:hypothetical protein
VSNGTVIICKGNGDVTCKNTIALPHYENAIATAAIKFPEGVTPAVKALTILAIEAHINAIQKIAAHVTGGAPYEFTGDPNALPECSP